MACEHRPSVCEPLRKSGPSCPFWKCLHDRAPAATGTNGCTNAHVVVSESGSRALRLEAAQPFHERQTAVFCQTGPVSTQLTHPFACAQLAANTSRLLDRAAELSQNLQVQQEVLRHGVRTLLWQICSPVTLARYSTPLHHHTPGGRAYIGIPCHKLYMSQMSAHASPKETAQRLLNHQQGLSWHFRPEEGQHSCRHCKFLTSCQLQLVQS